MAIHSLKIELPAGCADESGILNVYSKLPIRDFLTARTWMPKAAAAGHPAFVREIPSSGTVQRRRTEAVKLGFKVEGA